MTRKALAAACCLIAIGLPAWAAGGEDESTPAARSSRSDPDFVAGEKAVKAQQWPAAVQSMTKVVERDAASAGAWNYLGFSYRHMGELDKSFAAYDKALQINPQHRNAREYLGEAYLQAGRLDDAEAQLKALDKLCRLPCEQYRDLKEKIADYKKVHAAR
jgi:tetratricopeptide (TPR) repeat protein